MRGRSLPRDVAIATLTIVAIAFLLYLVYRLRTPLTWVAIAAFIAAAMSAPINWLSRFMPRNGAIASCYIGLLMIPIGMLAIVIPPLVREISDLIEETPRYADDLRVWVNENERLRELDEDFDITTKLEEEADQLPARAGDAASLLADLGLGLVNSAFAALTIFILAIFISANGGRWRDMILALGPPERAAQIRPTLDKMTAAVGGYVAGAMAQALFAGVTTFIVLTILGVPFAAPLAVLVGVFDLIPLVGATVAGVVVLLVTLFGDVPRDPIIWGVWAIAYQQLENNVIQPRIQSRAVGVHPFIVLVSVLFGATLLGVLGALLAVPVAAAIQIALSDWWSWRTRRLIEITAVEDGLPP